MTAAAVRPEPAPGLSLVRQQVSEILLSDEAKSQIAPLLPHGVSLDRVVSTIHQVVADNPEILECTPASIIMAVGKGVKWDLEFGETVHLVPFNVKVSKKGQPDKWEKRAKAIRDYKGDIEIVVGSGAARYVDAQCFYENEIFEYKQGTNPYIEHHPIVDGAARGKMLGAYAWAVISQRVPMKISVMSVAEIEKIRQEKSKSNKEGPLQDWYARKTLVHQVTKSIPKNRRLAEVLKDFDQEEIPDADFEIVATTGGAGAERSQSAPGAQTAAEPRPANASGNAGTAPAPAAEPVDDTPALEDEEPDLNGMTYEQAKTITLMGPPGSWQGKVGSLLDSFSNAHLTTIRKWLREKIEEKGEHRDFETMATAITVILEHRAKDQATLEFDSTKTAEKVGAMQGAKTAEPKRPAGKLPF
jgi:phage RecT family recombinase